MIATSVVCLLIAGILLNMVRPGLQRTMQADFANWLSNMAETGESSKLHREIKDLSRESTEWSLMLANAGVLIEHNKDRFRLPNARANVQDKGQKESPSNSAEPFQWLMLEWNLFNKQDNMTKTTTPVRKLSRLLGYDLTAGWLTASSNLMRSFGHLQDQLFPAETFLHLSRHVVPMTGGRAIGAP